MAQFETNSPEWETKTVHINGAAVLSVSFNEKANTTEINIKPGATYIAQGAFAFQTASPSIVPVKGTPEEVKKKLGL